MIDQIQTILQKTLPQGTNIIVSEGKGMFNNPYIKIAFAPSTEEIHKVSGQYPQVVSLNLNLDTMELKPQVFGCNGGQVIYRKPNLEDPSEKYLAMKSVKVPFRKPKKESKFVLKAIERFAENYIKTLRENKDTLMYQDMVDYETYLGDILSYMHVGQHGGANYFNCMAKTKQATEEEYSNLKKELENIGYNLRVIKKRNWQRYAKKLKEFRLPLHK